MFFANTSYKVAEYEKTAIVAPASAPEMPLRFLSAVGQCPISADFITEPEVTEANVQLAGTEVQSTTVKSFVNGAIVSIECTNIAPDAIFPGLDDATILTNYARFWSITPIPDGNGGITQQSEPVPHLRLEGTKDISGIEVTYSYRLFRFQTNFALVAVGTPKGTRDISDVERFLDSLEVDASLTEFSQQAKLEGLKAHMATCLPTIQADNDARDLGLTELEIVAYCSCTGERYFDEFSPQEFSALITSADPSLVARRKAIQVQCLTAGELPELNQIIVSGSYSDLENALLKKVWSKKELGAALIATAGVNKPAQATLLLEYGADVDFAALWRTSLILAYPLDAHTH